MIDYASSPTLTTIHEVAGDDAARALVDACGGRAVHVPRRLRPDCQLVRIVGMDAAKLIWQRLGEGTLRIPTGRGHGHGRRIDPALVMKLRLVDGWTVARIARFVGCTMRNVDKIAAKHRPLAGRDEMRRELFTADAD